MKPNLFVKMRTLGIQGKCHLVIAAAYAVIAGLTLRELGILHSLPEFVIAAAYARAALSDRP